MCFLGKSNSNPKKIGIRAMTINSQNSNMKIFEEEVRNLELMKIVPDENEMDIETIGDIGEFGDMENESMTSIMSSSITKTTRKSKIYCTNQYYIDSITSIM